MVDQVDENKITIMEAKKVMQIFPAENWFMETQSPIDDGPVLTRVACWATCENDEGKTFVTGLFPSSQGTLVECSGIINFKKYVYRRSQYIYESPQID